MSMLELSLSRVKTEKNFMTLAHEKTIGGGTYLHAKTTDRLGA